MKHTENKRGRPAKENSGLSAGMIINTAKRMMLMEQKVPSIRAISKELKVDPMALYYYFKNKNILLEEMAKSLIAEIYKPDCSLNWESELKELSKSYLLLLHRYEGLLETLLSMTSNSPAQVFIDRFNLIVLPLKLENRNKTAFLNLLVDYLHGFSIAMSCNKEGGLKVDDINEQLEFLFHGVSLNVNAPDIE